MPLAKGARRVFREALSIANQFTRPVVMSRQTRGGACGSTIGTYVIVNKDGWIVTAGHLIRQWAQLNHEVSLNQNLPQGRTDIENDGSIDRHEKKRQLAALPRLTSESNQRCSAWWGMDGLNLVDFSFINVQLGSFEDAADIGIGRLQPFDPAWVKIYPVFKDPTKDFEPGTSLCKLGFPLHTITPAWDDARGAFVSPKDSLPLPRFPIDGIFTRVVEVEVAGLPHPFPFRYVETSTPGLKGQSGGPTIDTRGTIWAIQAKTIHHALGFDPPVPNGKKGEKEHQFLNAGLGVHPDTIFGFFRQTGIDFTVSAY